ncbi:MAG: flavodoxin-dependent (E)-4-hydroxy-3-methylbut-2-enyl-diphosphate synthase [bacterium]
MTKKENFEERRVKRKKVREVKIGRLKIGGGNPVVVQGMTKTKTEDVPATVAQIRKLTQAGAKIVRIALPNMLATRMISKIRAQVDTPLVADVHFNHKLALEAIDRGIDKVRVNPGNMGKEEILKIAEKAKKKGIPLRVGINSGSLERGVLKDRFFKEKVREHEEERYRGFIAGAMVKSALDTIKLLEKVGFSDIVVSLKANDVLTTVLSYQLISDKIPYPLHLGITASGPPPEGIVKSSIAIGTLLLQGIGDTIRVSLTTDPVEEVKIGYQILKSLDLFEEGPDLISCPTCGRCRIDLKSVAKEVLSGIEGIKSPLKIAVMGCEVNGPGEAGEADVGIACYKRGGTLFKKGKPLRKVKEKDIVRVLLEEVEKMSQAAD